MLIIIFIVGFLSHFVSALVGGGGLISLPTMLLMGIPIHTAIAADKFGAVVSTFLTTWQSLRKKEIELKEITVLVLIGIVSGYLGGAVANFLSATILNYIAICLMFFAFIISLYSKNFFGDNLAVVNGKQVYPLISLVGFYDGIFGPGSSTLAIYVFSHDKMQYFKAVTLTRICLFSWCFGALISYILAGAMVWKYGIAVMCGAIIGGFVGVYVSKKVDVKYVKHVLRFMTLVILIQLVIKLF